jgi:tRNA threonylcarbamoyladenosine modification (KEOPS) complex  Pcc1 subunit
MNSRFELRVAFPSAELAEAAWRAVAADRDVRPDLARGVLRVHGRQLCAELDARNARALRVAAHSLLDALALAVDAQRFALAAAQ